MSEGVDLKVAEVKESAQPVVAEVKAEIAQEAPKETQEQINWKKFREAREQERKQNEALKREADRKAEEIAALKAALEAVSSKPSPDQQFPISEEETDDQRLQRKIDEAIASREKKYEQQRIDKEQQELPQRLNATFSDFNKVCTSENLDYLEYHHPEIADLFKTMPDSFEKWSKVYKMVKKFIPNPESQKDQKRADKNLSKPQSMSIGGMAQTGDGAPMMLDDKRRADNWARMQRTLKGVK